MSSPDQNPPWETPQSPSGVPVGGALPPFGSAPQPAPPPSMASPYGMPLNGGPEGPGGFGPGGYGPGPGDGNPNRRRKALIASALAVVAVVGIGGAVAFASSDSPKKHDSTALAGDGASATETGGGGTGGGRPDGDSIVGDPSSNGAQGANVPENPTGATSSVTNGGQPGQTGQGTSTGGGGSTSTTSAPGKPVASNPGKAATSAPGAQAPSAPKPSAPVTTVAVPKPGNPARPSSDCTYLDLPAAQMPQIKEGSGNVNAVKELQCLLKKAELGIPTLAIDGQWGSDTQKAMTDFQGCNNSQNVHSPGGNPPYPKLAVDGVAGPQTWADLYFWDNQSYNGTYYYCNGTR